MSTPVRTKVRRLEEQTRQTRMTSYILRKSPKAQECRKRRRRSEDDTETNKTNIQGAIGPLLGAAEGPVANFPPSKATGRSTEVRGRSPEMEEMKRARKVLDRWPHSKETHAMGPTEVKLKRGSSGPPRGKINKNQDQEEDRHSARKLARKRTGGGLRTPREEKGGILVG